MYTDFEQYQKKKEYLFCIDSDGCAMNTMDIKHIGCFGPCMVEEWNLSEWERPILERWNEINLYSRTRGINRFKGLAMALKEIDRIYCKIEGVRELCKWVEETPELSIAALKEYIQNGKSVAALDKALSWSEKVNECIDSLPEEKKVPFPGVKKALEYAHQYGDIAIVSSANRQAVEDEWKRHHLLGFVDIVLVQDVGSKAFCIQEMLKKGYDKQNVLMIGDAPGDCEAAQKNDVLYYPILVKKEKDSWEEFVEVAVEKFIQGNYKEDYMKEKTKEFWKNLQ